MATKFFAFILILVGITSNLFSPNLPKYSTASELWNLGITPTALKSTLSIMSASIVKLLKHCEEKTTAALCTYYTAMTLLVSVLALRLMWVPLADLAYELNLILSKTILYINRNLYPKTKDNWFARTGKYFGSRAAIAYSTHIMGLIFLYSASTDILNTVEVYVESLPKHGLLARMRNTVLWLIDCVTSIIGAQKTKNVRCNNEISCLSEATNRLQQNIFI